MPLRFQVLARDGAARLGLLETPHGRVETPAFMPVATLGAVKGLSPASLESLGARLMLCNLYHLAVLPGVETIERLGGLHDFVGWRHPILTDSGGYQIWSLEGLRRVDRDGVTFRNHHDGRTMRFTPETVVQMQERLGVDIAMALDECPPWPISREQAERSLERTRRWAERVREAWSGGPGGLFGIVQGSFYPDLRERAASEIAALEFDGCAIGGVSVGEGSALGRSVIEQMGQTLPEHLPRYLMGLGTPADLLFSVSRGIDLFDCVLPTRNARHGHLFTRQGVLKIRNARYRDDPRPIDPERPDRSGETISRAFLHHLFRCGEITGKILATAHNLCFYLDLMDEVRQALRSGNLRDLADRLERQMASQGASQGAS